MPNPATEPVLSYFHLATPSHATMLKLTLMLLSHILFGLLEWVFPQQHSIHLPCFPPTLPFNHSTTAPPLISLHEKH